MPFRGSWTASVIAVWGFCATTAFAQIDPEQRQLLHLGYNASFRGHAPLAGYAFYYLNRPQFYRDHVTLRMAIAPVYLDSELGVAHALGPNTDLGFGIAGGGFADSYREVRGGKYFPKESFDGHGGGASVSLYHRINPSQRVPLFFIARLGAYYVTYTETSDTADNFELPDDYVSGNARIGLRLGGREPILFPSLAMELSIWAESINRGNSGGYGFSGDRDVTTSLGRYYAHAYLAYTFERGDNFSIAITAGESTDSDRLSAYRLGGMLPLVAEYPLIIPGYFYQELSAKRFVLFEGRYAFTLDSRERWQVYATAATAVMDQLSETRQGGNWHSGVGGGIAYRTESDVWKVGLTYGYGIDARRNDEHGAHVVGLFVQMDVERWLRHRGGGSFPWQR
jgi:hypothetical protein